MKRILPILFFIFSCNFNVDKIRPPCKINADCKNGEVCFQNRCTDKEATECKTIYYLDKDGDGYGVDEISKVDCSTPSGYADKAGDCDDNDASINPGHQELCNQKDDNCNNNIDEDFDLQTDVNNCGTCGNSCNPQNVDAPLCNGGQCDYTACKTGFKDCNNNRADGCEDTMSIIYLDPDNNNFEINEGDTLEFYVHGVDTDPQDTVEIFVTEDEDYQRLIQKGATIEKSQDTIHFLWDTGFLSAGSYQLEFYALSGCMTEKEEPSIQVVTITVDDTPQNPSFNITDVKCSNPETGTEYVPPTDPQNNMKICNPSDSILLSLGWEDVNEGITSLDLSTTGDCEGTALPDTTKHDLPPNGSTSIEIPLPNISLGGFCDLTFELSDAIGKKSRLSYQFILNDRPQIVLDGPKDKDIYTISEMPISFNWHINSNERFCTSNYTYNISCTTPGHDTEFNSCNEPGCNVILPKGDHNITLIAQDGCGLESDPVNYSVTVINPEEDNTVREDEIGPGWTKSISFALNEIGQLYAGYIINTSIQNFFNFDTLGLLSYDVTGDSSNITTLPAPEPISNLLFFDDFADGDYTYGIHWDLKSKNMFATPSVAFGQDQATGDVLLNVFPQTHQQTQDVDFYFYTTDNLPIIKNGKKIELDLRVSIRPKTWPPCSGSGNDSSIPFFVRFDVTTEDNNTHTLDYRFYSDITNCTDTSNVFYKKVNGIGLDFYQIMLPDDISGNNIKRIDGIKFGVKEGQNDTSFYDIFLDFIGIKLDTDISDISLIPENNIHHCSNNSDCSLGYSCVQSDGGDKLCQKVCTSSLDCTSGICYNGFCNDDILHVLSIDQENNQSGIDTLVSDTSIYTPYDVNSNQIPELTMTIPDVFLDFSTYDERNMIIKQRIDFGNSSSAYLALLPDVTNHNEMYAIVNDVTSRSLSTLFQLIPPPNSDLMFDSAAANYNPQGDYIDVLYTSGAQNSQTKDLSYLRFYLSGRNGDITNLLQGLEKPDDIRLSECLDGMLAGINYTNGSYKIVKVMNIDNPQSSITIDMSQDQKDVLLGYFTKPKLNSDPKELYLGIGVMDMVNQKVDLYIYDIGDCTDLSSSVEPYLVASLSGVLEVQGGEILPTADGLIHTIVATFNGTSVKFSYFLFDWATKNIAPEMVVYEFPTQEGIDKMRAFIKDGFMIVVYNREVNSSSRLGILKFKVPKRNR